MRPYLTVIIDSFREAFASRVLWIVLFLIAIFHLLIFPLTYQFSLTTQVTLGDVVNPGSILEKLGVNEEKPAAGTGNEDDANIYRQLLKRLDEKTRSRLKKIAAEQTNRDANKKGDAPEGPPKDEKQSKSEKGPPGGRNRTRLDVSQAVQDAINELIENGDLITLKGVDRTILSPEAVDLADAENRTDEDRQRLNRLIIESLFEDEIRTGPPTSIVFSYLGMEIPGKFPIEKERLFYVIRAVLKYLLNFVFSTVGILMALIITSNIIPQTFEPGSLNLLLSKPISRWKLFVAQFVGGCAFVTLTMTFFFLGVWLFLGWRMGYWNWRLLFYIPSFITIFAVYFSASAVAGLIWRSSIVSVVAGTGLWVLTFAMYLVNLFCETSYENVAFQRIDAWGGEVIVSHVPGGDGMLEKWDPETKSWTDISQGSRSQLGLAAGPFLVPGSQQVVIGRQQLVFRAFGPPVAGRIELLHRDLDQEDSSFTPMKSGLNSTRGIFRNQAGELIVFASGELHRLNWNPEKKEFFAVNLGPEKSIRSGGTTTSFALNPSTSEFAVLRRGILTVYAPDGSGHYVQTQQSVFDQWEKQQTLLGFNGQSLVVFSSGSPAVVLDSRSLQEKKRLNDSARLPTHISASPDGRWLALLRDNGSVLVLDCDTHQTTNRSTGAEARAISFDDRNRLVVGDQWLRVSMIDPESGRVFSSLRAQPTGFQMTYQYVIYPLYNLFPKCGELNQTVEYLITGRDTADTIATTALKIMNVDRIVPFPLETYNLRPWPQVINAAVFILVMLILGSIIIERTDY